MKLFKVTVEVGSPIEPKKEDRYVGAESIGTIFKMYNDRIEMIRVIDKLEILADHE